MAYKIKKITMQEDFKVCPTCGYQDGFHSMLKREGELLQHLFICPSCHEIFDIGLTLQPPEDYR